MSRGRPEAWSGAGKRSGAGERTAYDGGSRAWESGAACRHQDADLWFSRSTWSRAMAICAACPVLDQCRAAVLRREAGLPRCHRNGVVAGLTGPQRHALEQQADSRPDPRPHARSPATPTAPREPAAPRPPVPAPCGTRAAYQRHLRLNEPVDDACRTANARGAGRYRRTGSTTPREQEAPDRARSAAPGSPQQS